MDFTFFISITSLKKWYNLSLAAVVAAVVLFSSELLIDELTGGMSVADLLESEETLFDAIRFGSVKGSPKPESSLPIN